MFPKFEVLKNISRPDRWARQCRLKTCSGRCRFAEKNFWEILAASSTRWSTSCKPTVSFLTESGNKNLHIILFPLDQYFISRLQAWTKIVLLLNLLVILRLTNFFKCNLCFSAVSLMTEKLETEYYRPSYFKLSWLWPSRFLDRVL